MSSSQRFKDKSERSVLPFLPLYALLQVLRDQYLFLLLCALLQSFVARSALGPLQSVAIPETVLSV